jgi:hypothetical protein
MRWKLHRVRCGETSIKIKQENVNGSEVGGRKADFGEKH